MSPKMSQNVKKSRPDMAVTVAVVVTVVVVVAAAVVVVNELCD